MKARNLLFLMLGTVICCAFSHGGAGGGTGRVVSGLIVQDDFLTLSAWTPAAGWAADGSFPTYLAYPSAVPLVTPGTGTASDSSGPRDAFVLINPTSGAWNISIQSIVGGTFTTLASGTDTSMFRDSNALNRIIARVRISVHGASHAIYINGNATAVATATDSTYLSGGSISFRATNPVRFTHFSMRSGNNVAVTNAGSGATVTLRGFGGIVLNSTTANGSGAATLSNVHFPAYSIDVNGTDLATGGVWGGDSWNF